VPNSEHTSGVNKKGKKMDKTEFLTAKDVAELLSVAPKTVYRLVDEGRLVARQIGGEGRLYFRLEDIKEMMKEKKRFTIA